MALVALLLPHRQDDLIFPFFPFISCRYFVRSITRSRLHGLCTYPHALSFTTLDWL